MKRHHPHHRPDFFTVLLLLVVVGFGMTLAVQVGTSNNEQVVDTEVVQRSPNAG